LWGWRTSDPDSRISTAHDTATVKAELELDKLRLETAKLRRDATWIGQLSAILVPMSVSMITAIVAIVGIALSVDTLVQQGRDRLQQGRDRSTDAHDKSLQQALSMATDGTGGSDRRISGIYQLRGFWANAGDEQVVAATLAALLVLPDSVVEASSVRCAAAEAIGSAYGTGAPKAAALVANDTRLRRIGQLLYGGADGSQGLVSRKNYLLRQIEDLRPRRAQEEVSPQSAIPRLERSLVLNCATPLTSTREAIRESWNNLRNTNLQLTDLSFSELYDADLHGALLMGANLQGTNLRCANLSDAHLVSENSSGANIPNILIDRNTDTTLLNIYNAKLRNLAPEQLSKITEHSINLPDETWLGWKESGFRMSVLKPLLGPNVPDWANSYDEFVCQSGG
jgi:hypothetical protein